jgi:pimeloyl-ACP methyl ester carboxylesterase
MQVEAGYDTTGSLVMNIFMTPNGADPSQVSVSPASVIRFAKGQIALFDSHNVQIPLTLPNAGIGALLPTTFLSTNTGASLVGKLAVSNIQSFASAQKASLTYSGSTAIVTLPAGTNIPTIAWTYAQSGSVWVPLQVQVTPSMTAASVKHTFQFSNLSVYDNPTADASRASQFTIPQASSSSYTNVTSEVVPTASSSSCNEQINPLSGAQNIAFEHGFLSDPCTWSRMTGWMNQDFLLGTELISKTNSTGPVADQAADFENQVNSTNKNGFIFVGHSMGGLVARYAAQYYQTANPSMIRGVVTLNTPHQGVNIAINGPLIAGVGVTSLSDAMYRWLNCQDNGGNFGCFFAWLGGTTAGLLAPLAAGQSVGAMADMTPGSSLLSHLNNPSQAENFLRAGIVAKPSQRWILARELDEMLTKGLCNPEDLCGERNLADSIEGFYDATAADMVLDILLLEWCGEYSDCPASWENSLENQLGYDAIELAFMSAIDGVSNIMLGCSIENLTCEGSDGLVQISSQYYPATGNGTPIQYPIPDADSHGGATRSDLDRHAMDTLLAGYFQVQQTASCSYTTNSNLFNLSATGGTDTFNVTTSQGCKWSAVSKQPWLSVTSGSTGMSNGAVTVSALPNVLPTPRTGTIVVGSPTSATTVTVTEAAICTYTLSPGPEISIPGIGGSGSVSVNTQTGCVWSAVSNASWLIISSATGTGSGSFQYSAVANSTGLDQSATVTVANQFVTVFQGTLSGSPGSGTVTINGSPQSTSINECPGNPHGPCMATIQEGGAVAIWVNGQSYSVQYSLPTDTSASLAAALAAQINAPSSFISARVSGSTITITATGNGTATNYPLSTTLGYNTSDFSSPAFWGTASGSYLTGGTN